MNCLAKVYQVLPTLAGWCPPEKAKILVELILDYKLEVVVEIGVFGGSSLIPQALALQELGKGVIYGIDAWNNADALEGMGEGPNRDWWSKVSLQGIYNNLSLFIKQQNLSPFCKLIRKKSEDAVSHWADNSIDLLHIDGNHSEEVSLKDVQLYLPKVKNEGFIVFSDFLWQEGGKNTKEKALALLLEHCEHIDVFGNNIILRKTDREKMHFSNPYDVIQYGKKLSFHPILEGEADSEKIVPVIFEKFHPTSVIDFGCNIGHWLKQFVDLGVTDILGIDGENMADQLLIPSANFIIHDLKLPFDHHRQFDMAICTETSEHLPESAADTIVASICRHSNLVVFLRLIPTKVVMGI